MLKNVIKTSNPVQGQTTRAIRTSITKKSQRHSITDSTVTWLISPHLKHMNLNERMNGVFKLNKGLRPQVKDGLWNHTKDQENLHKKVGSK